MNCEWLGRSKGCDRERRYQRTTPARPECEDQDTVVDTGVERLIHTLQRAARCLQNIELVQLRDVVCRHIEYAFAGPANRWLFKFELHTIVPIRQWNPVGKFALAETVVQALVIGEHGDAVGRCRIGGFTPCAVPPAKYVSDPKRCPSFDT